MRKKQKINWLKIASKVLLLLLVPVILIAAAYLAFRTFNYSGNYSTDFDREKFNRTNTALTIAEPPNSYKFSYQDKSDAGAVASQIESVPIRFTLKPGEYLTDSKVVDVSILFQGGENDWQLRLVCDSCNASNTPKSKTLAYSSNTNDWMVASTTFSAKEVKAAMKDKKVLFELNSPSLKETSLIPEALSKQGYFKLAQFNEYNLYGDAKAVLKNYSPVSTTTGNWLLEIVPEGSAILSDSDSLSEELSETIKKNYSTTTQATSSPDIVANPNPLVFILTKEIFRLPIYFKKINVKIL